jgi:hypothetical protein
MVSNVTPPTRSLRGWRGGRGATVQCVDPMSVWCYVTYVFVGFALLIWIELHSNTLVLCDSVDWIRAFRPHHTQLSPGVLQFLKCVPVAFLFQLTTSEASTQLHL